MAQTRLKLNSLSCQSHQEQSRADKAAQFSWDPRVLPSWCSAFPKGCPLPPCQRRNNVTSAFHCGVERGTGGVGRKWRIQLSFQGHGLEVVLTLHWPQGHMVTPPCKGGQEMWSLFQSHVQLQFREEGETRYWKSVISATLRGRAGFQTQQFDFQTKTLHYSSYCCLRRMERGQELVGSF